MAGACGVCWPHGDWWLGPVVRVVQDDGQYPSRARERAGRAGVVDVACRTPGHRGARRVANRVATASLRAGCPVTTDSPAVPGRPVEDRAEAPSRVVAVTAAHGGAGVTYASERLA